MSRKEHFRSGDNRPHRVYRFYKNPSRYYIETGNDVQNAEHEKPGEILMGLHKAVLFMRQSKMAKIREKQQDIYNGYGYYKDIWEIEKYLSKNEIIKCIQALDGEEIEDFLTSLIRSIFIEHGITIRNSLTMKRLLYKLQYKNLTDFMNIVAGICYSNRDDYYWKKVMEIVE